jgi:hypothetical protein
VSDNLTVVLLYFIHIKHNFMNMMADSGQIMLHVSNGDEFYIWAYMRAISQSGSNATSADAFNTGIMNFRGTPDLIPSASAVPLPAGIWLFCSGLIGLIGVARRKKS